jgi:hypothetical protein
LIPLKVFLILSSLHSAPAKNSNGISRPWFRTKSEGTHKGVGSLRAATRSYLEVDGLTGALEVDLDDEQHLVVLAANGLEEAVVTDDVEEHEVVGLGGNTPSPTSLETGEPELAASRELWPWTPASLGEHHGRELRASSPWGRSARRGERMLGRATISREGEGMGVAASMGSSPWFGGGWRRSWGRGRPWERAPAREKGSSLLPDVHEEERCGEDREEPRTSTVAKDEIEDKIKNITS